MFLRDPKIAKALKASFLTPMTNDNPTQHPSSLKSLICSQVHTMDTVF